MVDPPGASRPPGLRPPHSGDTASLTIAVDIGPLVSADRLATTVADLAALVDVGARWGIELARTAAEWDIVSDLGERGPGALGRALRNEGLSHGLQRRWLDLPWEVDWPGGHPEFGTLRDVHADRLLGRHPTVVRLCYENPVELILAGSGMLIAGVMYAARMARDWSAQRRAAEAIAREAEAEADMTEARSELYRWMVREARRGRAPIPIGDLVRVVTPAEVKALNRLSDSPITLELPRGMGE